MKSRKFDPKKLSQLNNPERLEYLNPEIIWDKLGLENPNILIDIGAGTGFFSISFLKKMKKGKIYACDIADAMIEWMRDNIPGKFKDSIFPLKMDESKVPLSDNTADLVYMINLHHELEEPVKLIAEGFRLLIEGGKIMIIDWKKEETPEGPPISIRVTEEAIEHQMRGGGFLNIKKYDILRYHYFLVGEKRR